MNIDELAEKADQGNISAINEAAYRYAMGMDVAVDHEKAVTYLEQIIRTVDSTFLKGIGMTDISDDLHVGIYSEYVTHEKIFCMYALEYMENGTFVAPDIRMRQFGDSAVVIWDGVEFIRRLRNELKKRYGESICIGSERVNYNEDFFESRHYNEFSKTEPYAWQNEYRVMIDIADGKLDRTVWEGTKETEETNQKVYLIG